MQLDGDKLRQMTSLYPDAGNLVLALPAPVLQACMSADTAMASDNPALVCNHEAAACWCTIAGQFWVRLDLAKAWPANRNQDGSHARGAGPHYQALVLKPLFLFSRVCVGT